MSQKHLKPLYWGIFSAGGTIAALALAPVIAVFCILLPLGILGNAAEFYQSAHGFVANKFVFLVLAGIIFT
ncbi:MAG: fumarate reductase subunit D, partial [Cardiobacteriaceae bacterium]|nr:fumarate reductase subunit D [Cardiobacteriaceae bacterium]